MRFKTNLHFHTSDDPQDAIPYTFYEGIDAAKAHGFNAVALTCHTILIHKPEYDAYARKRDILLIPGVERAFEGRHVLILNSDNDIEHINTLPELEQYKKTHPNIFVIAPHPFLYGPFCLKEKLEPWIHLFDAIEYCWFYSEWFNRNKKAERIVTKYHLPFISTSDTHILDTLPRSYAIIDAKEKTIPSLFEAIRSKLFENVSPPQPFWRGMVAGYTTMEWNNIKHRYGLERNNRFRKHISDAT